MRRALQRLRKPTIFLHVGAMKTGTTFLQSVLQQNQQALGEAGYLFPGRARGDQTRAVRDLLRLTGQDAELRASVAGMWDRLVGEMRAWDGQASIFSMEFLSFVERRRALRVKRALGRADLHVLLTVRDAAGMIPAQWQSYVRNHGTMSWPEFAHATMTAKQGGSNPAAKTFRRAQDVQRMLRAWQAVVPPERLHVITVPPSGASPSVLWERFASVCGLDPAVADLEGVRSNPSLGYGSSEFMRLANTHLADLRLGAYHKMSRHLGRSILSDLRHDESRPQLDVSTAEFAARWNKRSSRLIRRAGVPVVGNLHELPGRPRTEGVFQGEAPPPPPDEEVLAAARAVRSSMLTYLRRRNLDLPDDVWDGTGDDVPTAVAGASALVRVAGEAL